MNKFLKLYTGIFIGMMIMHQFLLLFGGWLPETIKEIIYSTFSIVAMGSALICIVYLLYAIFVRKEIKRCAITCLKSVLVVAMVFVGLFLVEISNGCTVQVGEYSKDGSANVTFSELDLPKKSYEFYNISIRGRSIDLPVSDYTKLYFKFSDKAEFDGTLMIANMESGLTVFAHSMENDIQEDFFAASNIETGEEHTSEHGAEDTKELFGEGCRAFNQFYMQYEVEPSDMDCSIPSMVFKFNEYIRTSSLLILKTISSPFEVVKVTKYEGNGTGYVEKGLTKSEELIVKKVYVAQDNIGYMMDLEYRGSPDKVDEFYSLMYHHGILVESPKWLKNLEVFVNKYQRGSCGKDLSGERFEEHSANDSVRSINICEGD